MLGWPLPKRPASRPEARWLDATLARSVAPVSRSGQSPCGPRPVRSRAARAPRMAMQPSIPVARSTIATPCFIGSPSGSPEMLMRAVSAWGGKSAPGSAGPGPERARRARGGRRGGAGRSSGRRLVLVPRQTGQVAVELRLAPHPELLEIRLALVQEGLHAFEALLGAPDMGQELHPVLPGGVELVGLVVQGLLRRSQRLRAVALDGLAPLPGGGEELPLRDHLVDEADLERLARGEGAREEDHLAGETLPDDARQVLGGPDGGGGGGLGPRLPAP